jgi:hypothetical protein
VYSGVVRSSSDTADSFSILFKFGYKPTIEEVSRLSTLDKLQGRIIPRALRHGPCKLGTAKNGSAFIIFEMFGNYVDCHLAALSRKEKYVVLFDHHLRSLISCLRTRIMNMLQKVHNAGFTPTGYVSCYVLEDSTKSKFKLFNMSDFEEHQVSPKAMRHLNWKDVEQNPSVICKDMMERAAEMDFWSRTSSINLKIYSMYTNMSERYLIDGVVSGDLYWSHSKPLPSSRIMQQLFPETFKKKYRRDEGLSDVAYWYFVYIKNLLHQGKTVDELKGQINEIAAKVEKDWIEHGVSF